MNLTRCNLSSHSGQLINQAKYVAKVTFFSPTLSEAGYIPVNHTVSLNCLSIPLKLPKKVSVPHVSRISSSL